MSRLPKLRVKTFPGAEEELRSFEKGKDLPFLDVLIFIEGKRVSSYEELVQLADEDGYRDRESLEVMVLSAGLFDGG
jgi:hypothetical protein